MSSERSTPAGLAGSTFAVMPELGHFPMSENPDRFAEYLLPVRDSIRSARENP